MSRKARCEMCQRPPTRKDKPTEWARRSSKGTLNVCPHCHTKVLWTIGFVKGRLVGDVGGRGGYGGDANGSSGGYAT